MGKDGVGISGDEHGHKTESLPFGRNRSAANPFFGLGSYLEKSWTLQDTGTGTQDGRTMDSRRGLKTTRTNFERDQDATGLGLGFFFFLFPFVQNVYEFYCLPEYFLFILAA